MDTMAPTPHVVLGPFYPVPLPDDASGDLFRREPTSALARSAMVEIRGRVVTLDGEPIRGALVEIWQANAAGRYAHPRDRNSAPLDPDFMGYGRQHTGADGRYRFRTMRPGAYHDGVEMRAPHVHFQVTGPTDRLVTQLFFANEPLHHDDRWFRNSRRPDLLEAPLVPARAGASGVAFTVTWDIVLGCA
jgi:protocatechuate 3,4-dioxygenase beta subunit